MLGELGGCRQVMAPRQSSLVICLPESFAPLRDQRAVLTVDVCHVTWVNAHLTILDEHWCSHCRVYSLTLLEALGLVLISQEG